MKMNILYERPTLIVFSVLVIFAICVSSVIAYVYYAPSSQSIAQRMLLKENQQPINEAGYDSVTAVRNEIVSSIDRRKNETYSFERANQTQAGKQDHYVSGSSTPASYQEKLNRSSNTGRNLAAPTQSRRSRSRATVPSDNSMLAMKSAVNNADASSSKSTAVTGIDAEPGKDSTAENPDPAVDEEKREPDAQAPDAQVLVSRKMNNFSGSSVDVMIIITIGDKTPNGLIIEESVPAGWNASNISHSGSFNASTNKIRWLFYGSTVKSESVSYKLESSSPDSKLSLSGMYYFIDKTNKQITQNISDTN